MESLRKKFQSLFNNQTVNQNRVDTSVVLADEHVIAVLNWLTREDSPYAVMYGNQEERFATEDNDYSPSQLLEIYKSENL